MVLIFKISRKWKPGTPNLDKHYISSIKFNLHTKQTHMQKYILNKINEEHVWNIFQEQNTNTKCCHTKKKGKNFSKLIWWYNCIMWSIKLTETRNLIITTKFHDWIKGPSAITYIIIIITTIIKQNQKITQFKTTMPIIRYKIELQLQQCVPTS